MFFNCFDRYQQKLSANLALLQKYYNTNNNINNNLLTLYCNINFTMPKVYERALLIIIFDSFNYSSSDLYS